MKGKVRTGWMCERYSKPWQISQSARIGGGGSETNLDNAMHTNNIEMCLFRCARVGSLGQVLTPLSSLNTQTPNFAGLGCFVTQNVRSGQLLQQYRGEIVAR